MASYTDMPPLWLVQSIHTSTFGSFLNPFYGIDAHARAHN